VVYSHPVLVVILLRLFNLIMSVGDVFYGFRLSYTVPYQRKIPLVRGTSLIISISSVKSKMFEHCVLSRCSKYLETSPNQFGFKKGFSCGHAIYSVRKVVEKYVSGGSTVNVCLLDLSKAFDKMNHCAMYI